MDDNKKIFIRKIYDAQIIQFGEFKLKSGLLSPFYIDMKKLVAFPELLISLTGFIRKTIKNDNKDFLVCGVPYGAITLAVLYASAEGLPLLLLRQERKKYGKGQQIEGVWHKGQEVILIEDVITTGGSIIKSIDILAAEGLIIKQIISCVDRQQGGREQLEKMGYVMQSIFIIEEIVTALSDILPAEKANDIYTFISTPQPAIKQSEPVSLPVHTKVKELLHIATEKKSNLILSADVRTTEEIWTLIRSCASTIAALKLHIDMITDFTPAFAEKLKSFSKEHRFLLIEDRKFADIGHTQYLQITAGAFNISSWADMVTMHFIAGAEAIKIMEAIPEVGIIGIVEMSSAGALKDNEYAMQCVSMMQELSSLFVGAVCQQKQIPPSFLKFTPGINLGQGNDNKGQQYQHPKTMLQKYGTDFIIVGRGIYEQEDPFPAAKKYQNIGWKYCEETLRSKLLFSHCHGAKKRDLLFRK